MRNPVNNIYIKKVEKKKMFGYDKEELWNTVIKTYTNVSQFWTYDKDAFLKQPVYSPRFPALQILRVASASLKVQTPVCAGVFLYSSRLFAAAGMIARVSSSTWPAVRTS